LIWGEKDGETPMYMAKRIIKKLPDGGLAVLKGAGHYCFLDNPYGFNAILNAFI
jgi:pimeloyl-ACP methyl ester carboxylesterase